MHKLIKYSLCLLLVILATGVYAQDQNNRNNVIQQRIELIAERNESDDIDYTTLIDKLGYYFDHPININATTREELEELNLLTSFQINNLLSYTRLYGEFKTFYELRTIEAFDPETIQNILPFVKISPKANKIKFNYENAKRFGKNDLFLRYTRVLEKQEGFSSIDEAELEENPNRRYLGEPNKYYARYRYQFLNRISFGLTAENDAGEEFFTGSNDQGFDFYSAHFFYKSDGLVKRVALGDFQAQFGQGLTMWSGLAYGKSPDAVNVIRYASKLKPYTSVNENQFLRGGGITLGKGNWEWTSFYSHKDIDANLADADTTDSQNEVVFTSIQTTGFHRTPSENRDENAITEKIGGTNLSYATDHYKIGATAIYSEYEGTFNRSLSLYNQFEFNDNDNLNLGADFTYISSHYLLFGEVAMSQNDGKAYLGGIQVQPDPRVNLIFYHRNFDKDYQNLFSGAISESSRNQNEKGTYVGTQIKLSPALNFTGYFDIFKFEWLRFQVDAPSDGADYSAQLNWKIGRYTEMYTRYRNEQKLRNASDAELRIDQPVQQERSSLRIHLSHRVNSKITLKSRVEFSEYKLEGDPDQNGFLLYQDVQYKRPASKWTVTSRVALFDVEDYDARIYAYENDVLYAFSVPAYFDRGIRTYLMTKYEIKRGLTVWARVARTFYSNRDTVGTGLDEIDAAHKTELKLQLRYKF